MLFLIRRLGAVALVFASVMAFLRLPYPASHAVSSLGLFMGLVLWLTKSRKVILRFGRLTWTQSEFCRHFLISGDTGCGKTTSGFHNILVQITRRVPNWGGLVLGVKGDEHRFLEVLANTHQREADVLHLQVVDDACQSHRRYRL